MLRQDRGGWKSACGRELERGNVKSFSSFCVNVRKFGFSQHSDSRSGDEKRGREEGRKRSRDGRKGGKGTMRREGKREKEQKGSTLRGLGSILQSSPQTSRYPG